nr:hypothetical protein [Tanacetum cinerariifolium]
FWNTIVVKQNNYVTRLQALVDKKKVVVTEAAIREVLRLDDAEGVYCQPNEEIFVELARMGYEKPSKKLTLYKDFFSSQWKFLIHTILQSMSAKRTSWNEFSSAMASAVICLSTEALDACAALTRRVEHLEYDKVVQALEITKLKSRVKKLEKEKKARVLELRMLKKVGTSQRINTSEDTIMDDASNQGRMIDNLDKDDAIALMDDKEEEKKKEKAKVVEDDQVQGRQAKIYKINMDHASKVLSMQEHEPAEVQEVVDVVTTAKLITEVVTTASETFTAASTIIYVAELQVPDATITVVPVRVVAASTRRRKGVVIRDLEEESTTIIPADTKSKNKGKWIMVEEPKPLKKKHQVEMDKEYARKLHAELNKDIDWDVAIDHVKQKEKEDPAVQRYQAIKKRRQTEAQAQKNMILYLKNVAGFILDYFKGMSYDDIRLIFEAKFNSNVDFLLKTKEQMEEEESRALRSINETPAQKAAKRRKLNEEVEDLKRHLEIVPDEDDDVYTEATSLARKNFDREDLESLWSLVKERFSTSKPNNFSDDFLLTTLGAMFEKPDGQDQVWKSQRTVHGQAKVKSWKLLESCGVHIITFTTMQLILLVKRKYPLLRFTLDQMLNAMRLRVEKQSEMCLELLRILLLNQILTFYNGITMIDQEIFMVVARGNFMRKTPQEAYDTENMTQHHFQWDTKVYYNSTMDVSAHYSETTFASRERVEVLGKKTGYTIQSVQHNPGPSHSNTFYYLDFDESDDDDPSKMIEDQKSIYHLSGSPTPFDPVVASLSPSLTPIGDSDSILEETDAFLSYSDDSVPDYKTFCFDMEEKSSGSTTSHSNHSLPEYESFCFNVNQIEEKSGGSTTSHSEFSFHSLPYYESFHFDLLIDPLPPTNRSDSHQEEFADELAHITSPPEYDCFYFDIDPDLGELTIILDSTKELTCSELNDFPLLLSNCDSTFSEEFYEIDLLVSFPYGNKDKTFNPRIFIIKGVQSKRFDLFNWTIFLISHSSLILFS